MVRRNPKRKGCVEDVWGELTKMNYGLVGETSAVQICRWTKKNVACEIELVGQNFFEILDTKSFASKSRNFHFIIPQKITAASPPHFLWKL